MASSANRFDVLQNPQVNSAAINRRRSHSRNPKKKPKKKPDEAESLAERDGASTSASASGAVPLMSVTPQVTVSHGAVCGRVVSLQESYGFLVLTDNFEGLQSLSDRFYFELSKMQDQALQLVVGSAVVFSMRVGPGMKNGYEVFDMHIKFIRTEAEIYRNMELPEQESKQESPGGRRLTVSVVVVNSNPERGFCFVKPLQQLPECSKQDNLFLHSSGCNSLGLPPAAGDEFEAVVNTARASKQACESAYLVRINMRSRQRSVMLVIDTLIDHLKQMSEDSTIKASLSQLEPIMAFVEVFTTLKFTSLEENVKLFRCVVSLINSCQDVSRSNICTEIVTKLHSGSFINAGKTVDCLISAIEDEETPEILQDISIETVEEFFTCCLRHLPSCGRRLLRLLEKHQDTFSKAFLLKFNRLCTKSLTVKIEDFSYNEVPLVPSREELEQMILDERAFLNISPVLETGAYASAEDYLETYFSLLRYDCFFGLLVGIKNYLGGSLDLRDMNVCVEGAFVGLYEESKTNSNIFVISAKPLQRRQQHRPPTQDGTPAPAAYVDNRSYMYGNLVGISFSGQFNDIVWATVYQRDRVLSSHGHLAIYLEFIPQVNSCDFVTTLKGLIQHSNSIVIAESPTYYNAYGPVLKAIQALEPKDLPFRTELVCGQTAGRSRARNLYKSKRFDLNLLYPHVRQDSSIGLEEYLASGGDVGGPYLDPECCDESSDSQDSVDSTQRRRLDKFAARHDALMRGLLGNLQTSSVLGGQSINSEGDESQKRQCVLDPSQEGALKTLLSNRVGIVQGPPGTGKTHLGFHLTNLLLSLNDEGRDLTPNDVYDSYESLEDETESRKPILVLTYKNHALDEFSKHILKSQQFRRSRDGSFIRLGSRTKDDDMKALSLFNFMARKTEHERYLEQELLELAPEMKQRLQTFSSYCLFLTHNTVLKHLDSVQLQNLIHTYCTMDKIFVANFQKLMQRFKWKNIGELLFMRLIDRKYSDGIPELENLLKFALAQWLPRDEVTERIRDEESMRRIAKIKQQKLYEKIHQSDCTGEEPADSMDPVAIARILEERAEAAGKSHDFNRIDPRNILSMEQSKGANYAKCLMCMNATSLLAKNFNLSDLGFVSNPWELTEKERICLLQAMLVKQTDFAAKDLQESVLQHQEITARLKSLALARESKALANAKVVAATITGAALKIDLLNSVKPEIIIVEEAAEISEAHLMGLLGAHVKHLILIGDHKQLRPNVECYSLVKKYKFDISMMERLIKNNLPFSTLSTQNRMRPEISKYLKDIYPDLQDSPRVHNNPPVDGVRHNIFFWDHDSPEMGGRSHTNKAEAVAVLNLVNYLTAFVGYPLSAVTVLSAYKGQTAILRKLAMESGQANIPQRIGLAEKLEIHTIDMFQGDENEIVIVSLVRNNDAKKLGFLNSLNRRCVAQSRGKSGVYFVGNAATLCSSSVWDKFIGDLQKDGNFGQTMTLQCKTHPDVEKQVAFKDAFPVNATPFCVLDCGISMPCNLHFCEKRCQPYHSHERCFKPVTFLHECDIHHETVECHLDRSKILCKVPCEYVFEKCGHCCTETCEPAHEHRNCDTEINYNCKDCTGPLTRKCYEAEELIKCTAIVEFIYDFCKFHTGKKLCHQPVTMFHCQHPCLNEMMPCKHKCQAKCEPKHRHTHPFGKCMQRVHFTCSACGNENSRSCFQEVADIKCEHYVKFVHQKCGKHNGTKKCHQDAARIDCPEKCGEILEACQHPCWKPCKDEHDHKSVECREEIDFIHRCGKQLQRLCHQKEADIKCSGRCKCETTCQHPCPRRCDPEHQHTPEFIQCSEDVGFKCKACNGFLKRQCKEKEQDILCVKVLPFKFPLCTHSTTKKCHADPANMLCKQQCEKFLVSCGHHCKSVCGLSHDHHDSSNCVEKVEFSHKCRQTLARKCNQAASDVTCTGPCKVGLTCGHACIEKCQPAHPHNYNCSKSVGFLCKACGENLKKQCHEDEEQMRCTGTMTRECGKCKCESKGPCVKSERAFECRLPCTEVYPCTHLCSQKCSEKCNPAKCKLCAEEKAQREKMEKEKRDLQKKKEVEEMRECLRKEAAETMLMAGVTTSRYECADKDEQYHHLKDMVLKFLNIQSGCLVVVSKVHKVSNPIAHKRWLEARVKLIDPTNTKTFCFLTFEPPHVVENYWKKGLQSKFQPKNTKQKGPAFRGHLEFSTESPKLEFRNPKFTATVLICDVLTGRAKTVSAIPAGLPGGFDSVYIQAGQNCSSKYAVYLPFAISVVGTVSFTLDKAANALSSFGHLFEGNKGFQKINIKPSREITMGERQDTLFRIAESQFLRLLQKNRKNMELESMELESVDYFENPTLEQKFMAKQREFVQRYGSGVDSMELLAFHGTPIEDPEIIMKENFRLDKVKRTAHGFGIYFSEFPNVSLVYGQKLLLARVLPGKSVQASCDGLSCRGHDSHLVGQGTGGYSQMVVIQNTDQILPKFILHLKK